MRVRTSEGQCFWSYALLYQWLTQTTVYMLQAEVKKAMSPKPLGKDSNMLSELEVWERIVDKLKKYGDDYKLNPTAKLNTTEQLMYTRKEVLEQMAAYIKSSDP